MPQNETLRTFLIKTTSGTFVLNVLFMGVGFLTTVLLARALGTVEYGVYNYVMTWVELLLIMGQLGLPRIITRNISIYQASKEWSLLKGTLRYASLASGGTSLILVVIAGVIVWIINRPEAGGVEQSGVLLAFWIGLLLIPGRSIGTINEATLQGLHHIVYSQIPNNVVRPLLFVGFVGVLYLLFPAQTSAPLVIALHVAATGLTLLYSIYTVRKMFPALARQAAPIYRIPEWSYSALPLLLSSGLRVLNARFSILVMGSTVGAEAISFFSVATLFATLISLPLVAANTAVAPSIANLYAGNDLKRLQAVLLRSVRITFWVAVAIAVMIILFHGPLLAIYGKEYKQAGGTLMILSIAQLVSVGCGSVGFLLTMTGHEWDTLRILAGSLVINVILNVLLIPTWGIEGAAIANASSTIAWNLTSVWVAWRRLSIHTTVLGVITSGQPPVR